MPMILLLWQGILKDFCSIMAMDINIDKTKILIIKSKKDTYAKFIYDDRNLKEVTSYEYLGIDIHYKLNWNSCEIKRNSFFKLFSSLLSYMVVKYGGAKFLENLGGRLSKSRSCL